MNKRTKNSKQWLFIVFMAGLTMQGMADGIDYRYVDSVTYHYYLNQSWDSLIAVGKMALKNNIDYYYLRMRMGVAYSAKEKYALSAGHFKKALAFNHNDKNAGTYLYDAYLRMGKNSRAYRLGMSFAGPVQKSLGVKRHPLEIVDVFGGYAFSNNEQKNGQIPLTDSLYDFGEQIMIGDIAYAHTGLKWHITPSLNLYMSGSYLNMDKTIRYAYRHKVWLKDSTIYDPGGGGIEYTFKEENVTQKETLKGKINQYEFYLNGQALFSGGWSLNIYGNMISVYYPTATAYIHTITKSDTAFWNQETGEVVEATWNEGKMEVIEKDTSVINWIGGFSLQKDFDVVKIDAEMSFSGLSDLYQSEIGLGLIYYPLGSPHLYGETSFTGFFQSENRTLFGKERRFLFHQLVGVRIFKKTWLEAEYLSGNLNNVHIKQGMVVYNPPEKINYITGANLHIFPTKHLEINLIYYFTDKEGVRRSDNIGKETNVMNTFKYQTQTIIGGIKWTF